MLKVKINNSYSQIIGATSEQHAQLRKLLSYLPDPNAAFFAGISGFSRRYLLDRKGFFPTGLVFDALDFIASTDWKAEAVDERLVPGRDKKVILAAKNTSRIPYPAQKEALAAAIQHQRGILTMPTGSGKSMVAMLIINALKLKTLIVVPNLSIKLQMQETVHEFFGKTSHITVENIDSSTLSKPGNWDLLLVDEAHHAAAKTYQTLNQTAWKNIYYRFFLTATPFRTAEEEQILLKAITGDVIYKLSYADAVKSRCIVPVEAFYVDVPKTAVNGNTWQSVYSEVVVHKEARNDIIADMLFSLEALDKPTLCLVKEIKHGKILSEKTGFPFVSGEDAASKKFIGEFNSGKQTVLIGTSGVLGEGVDTKPCEYCLIAGLGKARSAFMQQVGRAVRTYPGKESAKIILFSDPSHKWTKNHFSEQKKILLEEYGISAERLEV